MNFTFGKYAGLAVQQAPSTYLLFALENFQLPEDMLAEIGTVLIDRIGFHMPKEPDVAIMPSSSRMKTTYRQLSLKYHPDRGGSTEAMQAINEFYTELLKPIPA